MTDNDLMTDILDSLINAVAELGFERARDAIRSYGDEANPDQDDWEPALIDMIETAVGVAADASGEDGNDRWLSLGPEPGFSIRWAWSGDAGDEFADMVMATVARSLGRAMP